jgi:MtN3 and saliva related transmembrane protein
MWTRSLAFPPIRPCLSTEMPALRITAGPTDPFIDCRATRHVRAMISGDRSTRAPARSRRSRSQLRAHDSPGRPWHRISGNAAARCTTAAYLPQVLRVWHTRSTKDISLKMFMVLVTGLSLWLTYGIVRGETLIIAANATSLLLATTSKSGMVERLAGAHIQSLLSMRRKTTAWRNQAVATWLLRCAPNRVIPRAIPEPTCLVPYQRAPLGLSITPRN